MRWFRELSLCLRISRRVGAFGRAMRLGLTSEQARVYADDQYLPNQADLDYEAELQMRRPLLPWGSFLAVLTVPWSLKYMATVAVAETGTLPEFWEFIAYGLAQTGWMVLGFGVVVGRFILFDLYRQRTTIICGFLMLLTGTAVLNAEALQELFLTR